MYQLLPSEFAGRYFSERLERDDRFGRLMAYYRGEGFEFDPERVFLAVGLPPIDEVGDPFTVAIAAGLHPDEPSGDGHRAVSVVALRSHGVNSVLGGEVSVAHEPYEVRSFGLRIVTPDGEIVAGPEAERDFLERAPVEELARELNVPSFDDDALADGVNGLDADDSGRLAGEVYTRLLSSDEIGSLYPPAALEALQSDEPLVGKWAEVTTAMFEKKKAGSSKGTMACCSTSTSCNACSSSSSSCIKV